MLNFTFQCISESSHDDIEEIQSKRGKVDCILGVKKEDNEVLAVVRFEDGHHDLISTRILVSKCPKVIFIDFFSNDFGRIHICLIQNLDGSCNLLL